MRMNIHALHEEWRELGDLMMIVKLKRYEGNPILEANPDRDWENQCAFNPGAVMHEGKVHIL